jgi:hypothetical protein
VRHSRRSNWSERQEQVAPTFEKPLRQLKPFSRTTSATKSASSGSNRYLDFRLLHTAKEGGGHAAFN